MAREFTESQAIRNLQRYLRQLSFSDAKLPEVPIDGVYASETQRAVEIFQRDHGIPVTGVADRATWDASYAAYLVSLAQYGKPNAVDIFYRLPIPNALRRGDVGFGVAAVQYMLNEIFSFYADVPEIVTDGTYGEQTADAVRLFQKYASLPQSGEVDLDTWNHLSGMYNELFRNGNQ